MLYGRQMEFHRSAIYRRWRRWPTEGKTHGPSRGC